jgi:hypothetical protein
MLITLAIVFLVGNPVLVEDTSSMKTLIRAVSSGTLDTGDLGVLNPYFGGFKSIATFEDTDVYMSLGRNKKKELVIFGWLKGKRILSLNQATERWAEERLAVVQNETEFQDWKEFRALLRGAVFGVKEENRELEAVAFVGELAFVGPGTTESQLQPQPAAFRFVAGPRPGEVLAQRISGDMILASFQR